MRIFCRLRISVVCVAVGLVCGCAAPPPAPSVPPTTPPVRARERPAPLPPPVRKVRRLLLRPERTYVLSATPVAAASRDPGEGVLWLVSGHRVRAFRLGEVPEETVSVEPELPADVVTLSCGRGTACLGLADESLVVVRPDGKTVRETGFFQRVNQVLPLPDGRVAVADNRAVTLLRPGEVGGERKVNRVSYDILSLAEIGDGRLVLGTRAGKLLVFDPTAGAVVAGAHRHTAAVNALRVRGGTVISVSSDGRVGFWGLDLTLKRLFNGRGAALTHVALLSSGRFATADADGVVRLWTPDGRPIASHRPGAAVATLAAWGEDAVAVLLKNGKLVRIRLVEVVQEK